MTISMAELNKRDRKAVRTNTKADFSQKSQPTTGGATNMQKTAAALQFVQAMQSEGGSGPSANTSTSSGVMSGALSGAAAGGSVGGAYGAAAGAVIGGTVGGLKARSARKKEARRIRANAEAEKHMAMAQIEGQKATRLNQAMSNMAAAFGATLRSNRNIQF